MKRPAAVWGALLGAGVALEAWALTTDRQHWTLSRVTRRALRADTKAGRGAILAGCLVGGAWLAHHLTSLPDD